MRTLRTTGLAVTAALIVGGLAITPAYATTDDDTPLIEAPVTSSAARVPAAAPTGPALEVTGSLLVLEDAVGGPVTFLRVAGADTTIAVEGEDLDGARSGDAFTGTVRLPAEAVRALTTAERRELDAAPTADTEVGTAAIAATADAGAPALARGAVRVVETQAALSSKTHTVYVAVVRTSHDTCSGTCGMSNADIATTVSQIDSYWNNQSGGAVRFVLRDANGSASGSVLRFTSSVGCASAGSANSAINTMWEQAAQRVAAANKWSTPPGGASWSYYFGAWSNSPSSGRHLLVLNTDDGCAWNGQAGLGTTPRDVHQGGLAQANAGVATEDGRSTIAHELGHNLSFMHANLLACTTDVDTRGLSYGGTVGGCTSLEYHDGADVMGWGLKGDSPSTVRSGLTAISGTQRAATGLLPAASVTTARENGTVTLTPISASSGVRAATVTDPTTGDRYVLEYRNGTGRDEGASYKVWTGGGGFSFTGPAAGYVQRSGIRVLKQDADGRTLLLASSQGGSNVTALRPGETFQTRGALRFTAGAQGSQATVTVSGRTAVAATVSLSRSNIAYGQNATATVTVTSGGAPVTSGTVMLLDNWKQVARSVSLSASGTATFTVPRSTKVGAHKFAVRYSGTGTLAESTSPSKPLDVRKAQTTVTLKPSGTIKRKSAKFYVVVASSTNVTETGTVRIKYGSKTVGSGKLNSKGAVTIKLTKTLPKGTVGLVAVYDGSATLAKGTSKKTSIKVH